MKNIFIPLLLSIISNLSYSQYITIGKQVWMTRNLNVSTFRNGDPIPEAKTVAEWIKAGEEERPAWCYYNNDPANGVKYGKLYNWYAVSDPRGLAPKGWHIPSYEEWTFLKNHLGGEEKAGAKMKSKQGWYIGGNGTNSSGFSGLPGGSRFHDSEFKYIGSYGFWWCSTESYSEGEYITLDFNKSEGSCDKEKGLSVRCLKD